MQLTEKEVCLIRDVIRANSGMRHVPVPQDMSYSPIESAKNFALLSAIGRLNNWCQGMQNTIIERNVDVIIVDIGSIDDLHACLVQLIVEYSVDYTNDSNVKHQLRLLLKHLTNA